MKLVICSIHDTKAEAFSQPMFFQAVGQALRAFIDAVSDGDPKSNFAMHPEDFNLFRIGTFDDQTGEIIPEPPFHLGNGRVLCSRSNAGGMVPSLVKEG